jgi:hypothetical protein
LRIPSNTRRRQRSSAVEWWHWRCGDFLGWPDYPTIDNLTLQQQKTSPKSRNGHQKEEQNKEKHKNTTQRQQHEDNKRSASQPVGPPSSSDAETPSHPARLPRLPHEFHDEQGMTWKMRHDRRHRRRWLSFFFLSKAYIPLASLYPISILRATFGAFGLITRLDLAGVYGLARRRIDGGAAGFRLHRVMAALPW